MEETFQKRRKKKEVKEKKEKKGDKKEKQQAAVVFKNSMPGGASDSDEEDLFGYVINEDCQRIDWRIMFRAVTSTPCCCRHIPYVVVH